jgi:hypothetical protein
MRGPVTMARGVAARLAPTSGRRSSTTGDAMLLFFGEYRGRAPCPWLQSGHLVRPPACYSFRRCISRTRSATAVLSPDSESPGARPLRHRPGLGTRAAWRGSTRDTAGGPPRVDHHASPPGGGDRHAGRRRPSRPRAAPPAPPLPAPAPLPPHTLAQADSTGQLMSWPRVHMPLRDNRFLRWSRSRQRGWRRPPRGAAREAATVGAEADKRRRAGERKRGTAGGSCAADTWHSTAWRDTDG